MPKALPKARKKISNIHCVWGIICSLSSVDQERNNVSLFNIIEEIKIPTQAFEEQKKQKKPLLIQFPHELHLLFRKTFPLIASDSEEVMDIKISLIDPYGENLQEITSPLKFPSDIRRIRLKTGFGILRLTTTGDYTYRISIKNEEEKTFKDLFNIPLEVKEAPISIDL